MISGEGDQVGSSMTPWGIGLLFCKDNSPRPFEGSGLNQGRNMTQSGFCKDDCDAWKWVESEKIWRQGDKLGILQNLM